MKDANSRGKQRIDEALLIALACGSTQENAARTIGVSARTIQRRLADPEFQTRLTQIKSDMVHRTVGMLTAGSLEAVKTLMLLFAAHPAADGPPGGVPRRSGDVAEDPPGRRNRRPHRRTGTAAGDSVGVLIGRAERERDAGDRLFDALSCQTGRREGIFR